MKEIRILLSFFVVFLLSSCAEEKVNTDKSSYVIEFGTECGWCAGQEFIKVTETKVEYTRTIPCGEEKGTVTKNRELNKTEWEEVSNSFSFEEFSGLDHNTCNVCVDGCDEIIRIDKEESSHEIRYSPGNEIEGIETLKMKLNDLMLEFRDAD